MQAKRYSDTTGLDQNHLLGEMDRAQMRFEGLDCWILASTRTIFGKEREELQQHADSKGWGLVLLDWTIVGGLPRLATLCAAYREIADRYLTNANVQTELTALAKELAFEDALFKLHHDLRAAEVGFEQARAATSLQMDQIFTDRHAARKFAGASPTFLSQAPPVSRPKLQAQIVEWWAGAGSVLALLGDEGMGKSWAALCTLRALGAEQGGPIVITIPSPTALKTPDGLSALIFALSGAALNSGCNARDPEDFWRRRLRIWSRNRAELPQPRILILVDGLDELDPFDWNAWLAPLLDNRLSGLVRIILACRSDDWLRGAKPSDLDPARLMEILVGPFEASERDTFLESQGIILDKVSEAVLETALHPRTAFHVARLGKEIGDLTRITREQILLRDFQNRHQIKGGPLDADAFEQIVIQMARDAEAAAQSRNLYRFAPGDVINLAMQVTGHERGAMQRILSELVSGGWVQREQGSPYFLRFTDKTLPLAVGMALADSIQSKSLEHATAEVDRLLEPWSADDLIEPVLRMCAVVLVTRNATDALCHNILRRWAALSFHSQDAQDFWRRLHAFRPVLFLEMVETGETGSNWLGEWGVASLWEDQPECVDLVEAYIQRWLRQINLPRHRAHAHPGYEKVINRERSRQLRRLKALERHGGVGWADRLGVEVEPGIAPFHRAVRTIGFLPRTRFVPSLVDWALSAAASGRGYGFAEVAALLRDNPFDWAETSTTIENAVKALVASGTDLARAAAALLLEATGRPEDAVQSRDLSTRPAKRLPKPLFALSEGEVVFGQRAPGVDDHIVVGKLLEFAADQNLTLSTVVLAELNRIAQALPTAAVGEWLHGGQPLLMPILRWVPATGLAKIEAYIDAGSAVNEQARGLNYADVAQKVFPALSDAQLAWASEQIEAIGDRSGVASAIALRLLTLPFRDQISLLLRQSPGSWPDRADALLKTPTDADYLDEVRTLDFDGPVDILRSKLDLISNVSLHRDSEVKISDFDWYKAFTHNDLGVRRLALDLANSIGGEQAARTLAMTGWSAESLDPIEAYDGSAVLGALPDAELEPLIPRLNGEYCLRIIHERPALKEAAEARIWRWIEHDLEVARTSHSIGRTYCIYTMREAAFSEFVDRQADRVHHTLAQVWQDKNLWRNLLYDDGNGPGWPLLKALASHQPEFVKTVWREAVNKERGFSSSSINSFPAELPPGPVFDDVRVEMLDGVHTDDRLSDLVRILHGKGHFLFLSNLITERFGKKRPYDRVWAMVAAGFLIPSDESQALWLEQLAKPPGIGWLGEIYDLSRRSFQRAIAMRHWYERLGQAIPEPEAWISLRLLQMTLDERYVDIVRASPSLFRNKSNRVRWLNFLSPEVREGRKGARKALSDTWLRGQRYANVIYGR
ncbi:hypothetical protein C0214_13705 [Methylobacterium sp. DM1]|nr:hypothetical protein C0214_13705 [Methylobacterium sp. DM1]